jgi:predicted NAD/FAD-binding protein
MHAPHSPLRLAIIGGGISGLATAYALMKQARPGDRPLQIDLFERKSSLGGNADTVVVDLGDYIDGNSQPHAYLRWADLGVNDVNLTTYVKLKAIMADIGYLAHMKPLQDTTSYFNAAGTLALTDDVSLKDGVSNPRFALANADAGLLAPLIDVVHRSAINLLATVKPEYTVAHFFNACVAQPAAMLGKAAMQLKIAIDWQDPQLSRRVATVRDAIYYPRIAAMYFTDERGPGMLPLSAPFEYYVLQEGGSDAGPPDRRYFENGAQKWLEALGTWLVGNATPQASFAIHSEAPAHVQVQNGGVTVSGPHLEPAAYDLCVLATHADDALKLLHFDDSMWNWRQKIHAVLSQVSYTRGYGVCHTWTGKLPANEGLWRTYNVLQRPGTDTQFPYRMSYVENLHQNDPVNPQYSRAGLPLFLISMVKALDEIPVDAMLDRVRDTRRVDPVMFAALPRATQRHLHGKAPNTGYRAPLEAVHTKYAGKAWTVFKHNVLNAACIGAQHSIDQSNKAVSAHMNLGVQPECALLFGGGWTRGAGLQEQCIDQSQRIAAWVLPALRARSAPAPALPSGVRATVA